MTMRSLWLAVFWLVVGCAESHGLGGDAATDRAVSCGRFSCSAEEVCCLATGRCEPSREACSSAVPDAGASPRGAACGSNDDCGAEEFCDAELCFGWGTCRPRGLRCTDGGGAPPTVCGCDGRNYPDHCAAARAGVRVVPGSVACGEVSHGGLRSCGLDGECPDGSTCCAVSGLCVRADCEDCCAIRPSGRWACERDADCPLAADGMFCYGVGCDGPGECFLDVSETAPELRADCGLDNPTCGCDGEVYLNSCSAVHLHMRVDPSGAMCSR